MIRSRGAGPRAGITALAAAASLALGGCGVGLIGVIAGAALAGSGGGGSSSTTTTTKDPDIITNTPGSPGLLHEDAFEVNLSGYDLRGSALPSIAVGAGNTSVLRTPSTSGGDTLRALNDTVTVINGAFTSADVGHTLRITGATNAGNNKDVRIATVVNIQEVQVVNPDGSAATLIDENAGFTAQVLDGVSALSMGGGAASDGEAVTMRVFRPASGLAISSDLRVGALGANNCLVWMGLRDRAAADAIQQLDAGVVLDSVTGQRQYVVNNTMDLAEVMSDTLWHRYLINIRPDCFVEFYVDGVLRHISTVPVQGGSLWRPISFGGRALGGQALADNLLVTGTGPVGITQFEDGFAAASLTPTYSLGSNGGAPFPSIDSSADGQPAPSFNPGAGTTGNGEALSAATFNASAPLEFRADMRIPATSVSNAIIWAGLEGTVVGSANGTADLAIGVVLNAGSGVDLVQYVMYQSGTMTVDATRPHDAAWHSYKIIIRPDFYVEWHRDGALEHVSTQPLSSTLGSLKISLGGQAAGANSRVDCVAVIAPTQGEGLVTTQLTPTGTAPTARSGHGAIYDPRTDSVIIFGGQTGSAELNDVWCLFFGQSPQNGAWIQLTPTGGPPAVREQHVQVYDPQRQRMIIFGGQNGTSGTLGDVWALDLSAATAPNGTWTQLTPSGTGPTGLHGATGVFDVANDRLIVFGGDDGTPALQNTVYALQFSAGSVNGTWSTPTIAGTAPTVRAYCAGAYDAATGMMVIAGGDDGTGSNPAGGERYYLTLAPGAEAWVSLSPSSPPNPPAPLAGPPGIRRMSALAIWPGERRAFWWGGEDQVGATFYPPTGTANEVWTLDLTCASATPQEWFSAGPGSTHPSARRLHTLTWHPTLRRAVLFGGEDATPTFQNDVWEFRLP